MRRYFIISLLILVVTPAKAQDAKAVEQRVEVLRQQLRDVTDKQAQMVKAIPAPAVSAPPEEQKRRRSIKRRQRGRAHRRGSSRRD